MPKKHDFFSIYKKNWLYFLIIFVLVFVSFFLIFLNPSDEIKDLRDKVQYIDKKNIKIGVLAKRGSEICQQQWGETAVYLNDKVKDYQFEIVPLSFEEVHKYVVEGLVDFVLVNPSMYVELELNHKVSRMLTLKNICLDRELLMFGGVIFTSAGNGNINSLEDIKGKRFCAVNEDSFGGWLLSWKEFLDIGIDPYKEFEAIEFAGTHDDVVYNVVNKKIDAGTVRTDTIERMAAGGLIDISEIKILNKKEEPDFPFLLSTELYPEWAIAKTDHVKDELVHKVSLALMEMTREDKAAKDAKIAGWTVPQNYRDVNEILKILKMQPYENYGNISFFDVLIQYKWFFLIINVVLILYIIYNIRYRILVEKINEALDLSKKLEQKANEASKAKSMFLANMSHEIRTPMNAIIGLSDLMFKTQLNAKQLDYNKKVYGSAKSLLGIINNILDFSKIEAGKMEIEHEYFSFDEVIYSLSNLLSFKVEKKGIELLFDVENDIPLRLRGDSLKLTQVLINLLNNSLKFTDEGHIIVRIKSKKINEQKINIIFEIEDTGIGMTDEQVKKLFSAFSQADASTTRRFGGTGLGLTISKQIIELMNGEISVKSDYGKGSLFAFNVVLEYDKNFKYTGVEADSFAKKMIKILVVDDNSESRAIVHKILENLGFFVLEAGSGEEALAIVNREELTLIILDYKMQGMNGIETVQQIKSMESEREKAIPKIMMISAYGKDEIKKEAEIYGIERFLDKPINASHLYNSIMEIFGQEKITRKRFEERIFLRKQKISGIHGAKLLIVEDNEINQQVASEILTNEGFTVIIANNGLEAIKILKGSIEGDIDAVLMDIQMPLMDGREATKVIREMGGFYEKIPVIALTAHAFSEEKEKNIECGMNDQINKPIDINQIFDVLVKHIKPKSIHEANQYKVYSDSIVDPSFSVEGIDIKDGLGRVQGNEELYRKLLEAFYTDIKDTVSILGKNYETGDYKSNEMLVHSIKGTGANLGIIELSKSAAELEKMYKNNSYDQKQFDDFTGKFEIVMKGIKKYLEEDVDKIIELTPDNLIELDKLTTDLQSLYHELESYNSDAMITARDLNNKLNSSLQNDFNGILILIDELQFEEALEALKIFLFRNNIMIQGGY